MLPIKKILWPTDFSDASYKALGAAKELASRFSAELWVLHVVQLNAAAGAGVLLSLDLPKYEKELMMSAKKSIDQVIKQRVGEKYQVQERVIIGAPAEGIAQIAAEEKIDIIVIATHGESAFHHFVFGSVAEKVIRLASCPVLVIRAQQKED